MVISERDRVESLQRQRDYLARQAEYEQLKQDKRELRRKAAKRKAKERDDIRKQRKLDKLAPRQFKDDSDISQGMSTDGSVGYSSRHRLPISNLYYIFSW